MDGIITFSVYISLCFILLYGVHMKRFEPTTDEQEHSCPVVYKVCAEYFSRLMSIMSKDVY